MSSPYTVAILGSGIGLAHLAAFIKLPTKFKVKYLCDPKLKDLKQNSKITDKLDIQFITDYKEVLKDKSIDIVDICIPTALHYEVCLECLMAEKQVICEKPICLSLKQADHLIDIANENKRNVFPVFQYRFNPSIRLIKNLINNYDLGLLYSVSAQTHWFRNRNYYRNSWRGKWSTDGVGVIATHAIHMHDIIDSILGPVKKVQAVLASRVNLIEVDDCAAITFKLTNGALVTSSITLGSHNDESKLFIAYENLTIESDPAACLDKKMWKFYPRNIRGKQIIEHIKFENEPAGYLGLFTEIYKFLNNHENQAVLIKDGRRSIELLSAIYHSNNTNRQVTLPIAKSNAIYNGWF